MKKKTLILSIITILITMLWTTNVLAVGITSAKMTINTTSAKTEYEAGDTVTFIIRLKDLKADKGIFNVAGTIIYNSNVLELSGAKECDMWENPRIGSKSNIFYIDRKRGWVRKLFFRK